MKAWLVTDGESYEIVRAPTRGKAIAKSLLWSILCEAEGPWAWPTMKARRIPELDGDFKITDEHYLRAGISVSCPGCYRGIEPEDLEEGKAVVVRGAAYHWGCYKRKKEGGRPYGKHQVHGYAR